MEEDFWTKEENFWTKWVFRLLIAGMAVITVMQSLPRKFVSERVLRSGMAIKDSICYRKPVAVGSILECRNRIVWDNGEEEIVDLPFPLFRREGVRVVERTIKPPYLPPRRKVYYK